jgi:hypothetical protein
LARESLEFASRQRHKQPRKALDQLDLPKEKSKKNSSDYSRVSAGLAFYLPGDVSVESIS